MKKILQMYANMGDIAGQIDVLEDKMKYKKYNIQRVGGAILKTKEDVKFMINLQWARIRALEEALLNSENEVITYVQDLRDSMCNNCIMNTENPCQKDYVIMTLYKTLKEVIV